MRFSYRPPPPHLRTGVNLSQYGSGCVRLGFSHKIWVKTKYWHHNTIIKFFMCKIASTRKTIAFEAVTYQARLGASQYKGITPHYQPPGEAKVGEGEAPVWSLT